LKKIQVHLGREVSAPELARLLQDVGATQGATTKAMGNERQKEHARHWHMTRGKGGGTLEVTLDRGNESITVAVHDNRQGNWAGEALDWLGSALQESVAQQATGLTSAPEA